MNQRSILSTLLLLTALAATAAPHAWAQNSASTASVDQRDPAALSMETSPFGSYGRAVQAHAFIKASPSSVYGVLTDYEHYAEFMPNVDRTTVLERRPDLVRYRVDLVMMRFYRYEAVCERNLEPNRRISWDDSFGHGQRSLGSWQLAARDGGTELSYHTKVDPGMPVPGPLVSYMSDRGVPDLIASIRRRVESGGLWHK